MDVRARHFKIEKVGGALVLDIPAWQGAVVFNTNGRRTAFLLASAPVLKAELIQARALLRRVLKAETMPPAGKIHAMIEDISAALALSENRGKFDKLISAHIGDVARDKWEKGERMGPSDMGTGPETAGVDESDMIP